MINVFLSVYFDVFRQSSRFIFRRSKQSSFYVFGVFVHGREVSLLTYFYKVRVLIRAHQNRVRSMVLEFVFIVEGGGPVINVFVRVYFDVFRQSSRCNLCPSKQSSLYVFRVFVDSKGKGGSLINVFLRAYFDVFRQSSRFNFLIKKEFVLCFWSFSRW